MRPWLILAFAFALGGAWSPGPPAVAIAGCTALILALLALRYGHGWAVPAAYLAAGVVCAGAGVAWREAAPSSPGEPLVGVVQSTAISGARSTLRLSPDGAPAFGVRVVLPGALPAQMAAGARVLLYDPLTRPAPADNPGSVDFRAVAERGRTRWVAFGMPLLLRPASGPALWLAEARLAARARLDASHHPFGADVLAGLALGDRGRTPEAAKRAFAALGTGHLLAVSGLHVGATAGACLLLGGALARRAQAVHPGRWAAAAGMGSAALFVALTGFSVSATRAGLMVGVLLIGRLSGRRGDPLNLLGLAAVVLLLQDPEAWRGVGFQLSFVAVGVLLTLGARRKGLVGVIWLTLIAWAATAPIQAWHFGTAAPASPLGNLLLTPVAALLVPFALGALAIAPLWSQPLDWAAAAAEALVALAESLVHWVGEVQVVGAHAAPLLAAPLLILWAWRRSPAGARALERDPPQDGVWPRRTKLLVVGGLILSIAALGAGTLALAPPDAAVDFIAVGQGDAALVRAGGKVLLVDAGPDPKARALIGFLRHLGVRRIDRVLISHIHPDHYLGLEAIAEQWPIGVVEYNGRHSGVQPWRAALSSARRSGATVQPAQDRRWRWGATALHTFLVDAPAGSSENDASVALRVDGESTSVLFTGDLERRGEARLLATDPAPVTILKAAHHGSRTSSDPVLLEVLAPKVTVFPVGRRNRYHFPHPQVVARHRAVGAAIRRLDVHGWTRAHLAQPRVESLRGPTLELGDTATKGWTSAPRRLHHPARTEPR